MSNEIYIQKITNALDKSDTIKNYEKVGLCRVWSARAKQIIEEEFKNSDLDLLVEVREVDLEPDYSHTFLKVKISDEDHLILDGVGTTKYPPYFGSEDSAPIHLQNSHRDWIDFI